MKVLLHHLIQAGSSRHPQRIALEYKDRQLSYRQLDHSIRTLAADLSSFGINRADRVAIYLPKTLETVVSFFAISACGAIFVPINPLLKPAQVEYILEDCDVKLLITSTSRLKQLLPQLSDLKNLQHILLIDEPKAELMDSLSAYPISILQLQLESTSDYPLIRTIDTDTAAILYTSGSTGKPKGVVLSHRNLVCGAESVADYLDYLERDRILAVLPFSFDYGLSQLTSTFYAGARVVLMEYLLPRDVVKAVDKYQITGLAAVPPLWIQLANLEWPLEAQQSLRFITNSGGALPVPIISALRQALPTTQIFLMYGLTEAFRSTFLPPEYIDQYPESMGHAIPNADILVLREDGSECSAMEPGELVHRGSLVAKGYWNNPEATAKVFKPLPSTLQREHNSLSEIAVFSGDQVYRDEQGLLYFVNRRDEMIKTSGYRISPTEIEELCFQFPTIIEAVAIGLPHPQLGQAITIILVTAKDYEEKAFLSYLKRQLPNFMQPGKVLVTEQLPRNPNGKIDRKQLTQRFYDLFLSE